MYKNTFQTYAYSVCVCLPQSVYAWKLFLDVAGATDLKTAAEVIYQDKYVGLDALIILQLNQF